MALLSINSTTTNQMCFEMLTAPTLVHDRQKVGSSEPRVHVTARVWGSGHTTYTIGVCERTCVWGGGVSSSYCSNLVVGKGGVVDIVHLVW